MIHKNSLIELNKQLPDLQLFDDEHVEQDKSPTIFLLRFDRHTLTLM